MRRLTQAAEQIVALAGGLTSFGAAGQRVLRDMAGLRVSASTVQRTAECVHQFW